MRRYGGGAGRRGFEKGRQSRPEADVVQHPLLQARSRRGQLLGKPAGGCAEDASGRESRYRRVSGAAPSPGRFPESKHERLCDTRHGSRFRRQYREIARWRGPSDDHVPQGAVHPARQRVFLVERHARETLARLGRRVPPRHGVGGNSATAGRGRSFTTSTPTSTTRGRMPACTRPG